MPLKFEYGIKFEIDRIKNTLDKLEWYKKKGYKPLLSILTNNSTLNIESVVRKEYRRIDYQKKLVEIKEEYNFIKKEFEKKIKKKFVLSKFPVIKVILTKYGVGGSYFLPNIVIINIEGNQIKKPIIEVLKHEIIHLFAEKEVINKKLTHREKELLIKEIESKI